MTLEQDRHAHSHHDHDHHNPDNHHAHFEGSWWEIIASALHLPGYGHNHVQPAHNDSLYTSELGIRTVKLALLALGVTTLIQVIIYLASGSVALLADTVHNLGDALNTIPLWIAFLLGRRAATKRYTYGYGRAEDIAGLLIVVSIAFSAGYILWESIQKFINPEPLTNLGWVAAAAIIGFLGNEIVAVMQINVGRRIGSEALVTDGRHARIDGLTSLAVLAAVVGTWLGFPIFDPIIGILIGLAILFITRDAIVAMWYRLMDAVDPDLVERAEATIRKHSGIKEICQLRLRWVGHRLFAEGKLKVEPNLTLVEADAIAEAVSHDLKHNLPNLSEASFAIAPLSGSETRISQQNDRRSE